MKEAPWRAVDNSIRLLTYGLVPYITSQAIYHAVAESMTEKTPDTLVLLWPDRPHFCVGYHQDPRLELDLDYCRARGLPILRRRVGGGTTYLDCKQLYYQLILHHRRAPALVDSLYQLALAAPVQTLRALGLPAHLEGVNELVVRGKRIAGVGAGRIGEAVVVVGNFLFDFDYETMADAWCAPNPAFRELAREGMEQSVTTLGRELNKVPEMVEVQAVLIQKYRETLQRVLEPGQLNSREEESVRAVAKRLGSDDWLFEGTAAPRRGLKIAHEVWMHETGCALMNGDRAVELAIILRRRESRIERLIITAQPDDTGINWERIAAGLVGQSLEDDALRTCAIRFVTDNLIPSSLSLEPLVKSLAALAA